jgi:mono/diheme cytochrome c family protein
MALALIASVQLSAAQTGKTQRSGIFTEAQAKRGETVYRQNCASCHGHTLSGAEGGPALVGPDFDSEWNGLTIKDLFDRIRISMPQSAPGSLSNTQYMDVIAFLLKIGKAPAGEMELTDITGFSDIRYEVEKQ